MHQIFVVLHSLNRFDILILLLIVIFRSLKGWASKSPFEKADDKWSFFLFIATHIQLVLGLVLYFISPVVVFSNASMKDPVARYWLVEHITGMLIAVVLISLGRILTKKVSDSTAKYKRLFIYNAVALVVILAIIAQNHRGLFSISW